MPRHIRQRRMRAEDFLPVSSVAGQDAVPLVFFSPPKGINYAAPQARTPREYAVHGKNFRLERGFLRTRPGLVALGPQASGSISTIMAFDRAGSPYTLRGLPASLEIYDDPSDTWIAISGMTLTGTASDFFTFTSWNQRLLVSNGVDGLFEVNPSARSAVEIAAGFPTRHLTAFAGRVVESYTVESGVSKPTRIRWSVRNDSEDFTGIGSGFEDLLSPPGGVVDEVMATLPVNDEVALVLRSESVWVMSQSGVAAAPFRFSRRYAEVGCRARHTAREVPGGVMFLGEEDVFIATHSELTPMGEAIRRQLFADLRNIERSWAAYDHKNQQYILGVMEGVEDGINVIYRYSFPDGGWSRDEYPFRVKSFCMSKAVEGSVVVDDLTGTVDELVGPVDLLGVDSVETCLVMAQAAANGYVARENVGTTQDITTNNSPIDSEVLLETDSLTVDDPLHKLLLILVQLEYVSAATQTIVIEYSDDGGDTWTAYGSEEITSTTRARVKEFRGSVERESIKLRLRATTLGDLKVLSLVPRVIKGARII